MGSASNRANAGRTTMIGRKATAMSFRTILKIHIMSMTSIKGRIKAISSDVHFLTKFSMLPKADMVPKENGFNQSNFISA